MDSELRSVLFRYTMIGIVLVAAGLWAVNVTPAGGTRIGAPGYAELDAGTAPESAAATAKAPSIASMLLDRGGVERLWCAPACKLEAYCGFRDEATCMRDSCEGELRIKSTGDAAFARADDCASAAAAPCADACGRKAQCGNAETAVCLAQCRALAVSRSTPAFLAARCTIEANSCADVTQCAWPAPS